MAEKMIGVKNFARNTDPGDNIYTWDTKIADKIEDFQEFSGFFDFFRQTFQVCEADLGYHRAISQGERHKRAEQSAPQRTEDWMRRRRRGHTRPPILVLAPCPRAHYAHTPNLRACFTFGKITCGFSPSKIWICRTPRRRFAVSVRWSD